MMHDSAWCCAGHLGGAQDSRQVLCEALKAHEDSGRC